MAEVPDKIRIDNDEPQAEFQKPDKMIIDVNGRKEEVTPDQAFALAMNILYQWRLMHEHGRS